jgi:predicted transcriptional regulator
MKELKLDRTKLKTVTNYAKELGVTRQTIYNKIKSGELTSVKIDDVVFIKLK